MSGGREAENWRRQAARQRQDKAERLRRDAQRRLRRFGRANAARLAFDGPSLAPQGVVLDSERFAAPLAERLGPRERVQLVLWGSLAVVLGVALVSFFSAPLMDFDTALAAVLIAAMLALSYIV